MNGVAPPLPHVALILAAGFSRRMGRQFKPLLPIPYASGTCSALGGLARLYRNAGVPIVIVVGGQRQGDALYKEATRLGLTYVSNPCAAEGMFSSLRVGLFAAAKGDGGVQPTGVFVHPVDIALVRPVTLSLLQHAARTFLVTKTEGYPSGSAAQQVLIPTFLGEPGHPPFIPASFWPALLQYTGTGGLRAALQHLPCQNVPVPDAFVLQDMDTPADYDAVCAAAASQQWLS